MGQGADKGRVPPVWEYRPVNIGMPGMLPGPARPRAPRQRLRPCTPDRRWGKSRSSGGFRLFMICRPASSRAWENAGAAKKRRQKTPLPPMWQACFLQAAVWERGLFCRVKFLRIAADRNRTRRRLHEIGASARPASMPEPPPSRQSEKRRTRPGPPVESFFFRYAFLPPRFPDAFRTGGVQRWWVQGGHFRNSQ